MVDASGYGFLGMLLAIGAMFFVLFLVIYVYTALVLMTIAKKTKTDNAWLAWIPVANIYLMTQVAGVSGWLTLLILAGIIPIVGALVLLVFMIWLWWKIAEARNRPGWWGILMLIPIVGWILMGILAWGEASGTVTKVSKGKR